MVAHVMRPYQQPLSSSSSDTFAVVYWSSATEISQRPLKADMPEKLRHATCATRLTPGKTSSVVPEPR